MKYKVVLRKDKYWGVREFENLKEAEDYYTNNIFEYDAAKLEETSIFNNIVNDRITITTIITETLYKNNC